MLEKIVALANEGQDDRAQYLIAVSDSIQITNNDMQLCAMSMGYSHRYQYASASVGHFAYDGDISFPLPCAAPHTLPPICSVKLETWLVTEEDILPLC